MSVIGQDVAISATVLRAANSAAHYRGSELKNVAAAVAQLGLLEVGRLAAAVAGRSLSDLDLTAEYQLFAPRWQRLFHRSMTVAFSAGWLASEVRRRGSDRAFSGGMFHDVGKSIALRSLAALVIGGHFALPASELIDAALERVHVAVGEDLHRTWNLPDYLTDICRRHHDLPLADDADSLDVHVVRLVAALAELHRDPAPRPAAMEEAHQSLTALRLPRADYDRLLAHLAAFADRVTAMFGVTDGVAA